MNTLSYKTVSTRKEDVTREWYIVDAEDMIVGRLATRIATILRGKHKPSYTPHIDDGDYVIIVNADKIRFTGNKMNAKEYIRYSGYPGGQKRRTAKEMLQHKPNDVMEKAVRGMLPKNRLGRQMIKKLFIYTDAEHPHQAQQPKEMTF